MLVLCVIFSCRGLTHICPCGTVRLRSLSTFSLPYERHTSRHRMAWPSCPAGSDASKSTPMFPSWSCGERRRRASAGPYFAAIRLGYLHSIFFTPQQPVTLCFDLWINHLHSTNRLVVWTHLLLFSEDINYLRKICRLMCPVKKCWIPNFFMLYKWYVNCGYSR